MQEGTLLSATQGVGAGGQEVSGCPLLLTPGLACTWLLETHQETGAWVEPCVAGYVTFGSLVLSEVSFPLHVAEGCPLSVSWPSGLGLQVAQCIIWVSALLAWLPSAIFSLWLLGDLQAGMYLNSSKQSSLALSFASPSSCRCL